MCVGGSATFTCTVSLINDSEEVTSAGWEILNMGGDFVSVVHRDRHKITRTTSSNGAVIIENLTIVDANTEDNGTLYRCNPIPILQLLNNTASLDVAGTYLYTKY